MRAAYPVAVAGRATEDETAMAALLHAWDAFWAIPHIRAWLTAGWALYLLWLGGWIVLQKREPAATLSWLGGVRGQRVAPVGTDRFGQTGSRADLYGVFGIDAAGIAEAAFSVLEA